MSREFGDYFANGYMHSKILNAQSDCLNENTHYITKEFGSFLGAVYDIAHNISSLEECDMGQEQFLEYHKIALLELETAFNDFKNLSKNKFFKNCDEFID